MNIVNDSVSEIKKAIENVSAVMTIGEITKSSQS